MLGRSIFFFNDTATTEIYTLSLHDALPIWRLRTAGTEKSFLDPFQPERPEDMERLRTLLQDLHRSEEHTSELQSRQYLVCRLLLEKKKHSSYQAHKSELHSHHYLVCRLLLV